MSGVRPEIRALAIWIGALTVGLGSLGGCREAVSSGGHAHGAGGHGDHGGHGGHEGHGEHGGHGGHGGHDSDGRPGRTLLGFGERFEVFAEYPALARGATSRFAMHVSYLDGYEPLREGKDVSVAVVLTSQEKPGERFETSHARRPGIFPVEATPEHAGTRQMTVVVRTPEGTARIGVGEVPVYPSVKAAGEAGEEASGGHAGGNSFLKEQQWQFEFGTTEARRRSLRPSLAVDAEIAPVADGAAVVRAPVSGEVLALGSKGTLREVGTRVEAGEVMTSLAPKTGSGDLAELRLAVERAKVAVDRAEREKKRMEKLREQDAVPEKRLLDARDSLREASAELKAARRRLRQRRSLGGGVAASERVSLRAPVDGSIVKRNVTVGSYVEEGDVLFRIVDAQRLRLVAHVPESDASRIQDPSGAWFHNVARPSRPDSGSITTIDVRDNARLVDFGQTVDPATRSVALIFEMNEPPAGLQVGQYLRAHVWSGPPRQALAVPASALIEQKGMFVVYVMTGGESFERRIVRTGIRDRGWVEITDGLEPGERVVSTGSYLVRLAGVSSGDVGHGHAH